MRRHRQQCETSPTPTTFWRINLRFVVLILLMLFVGGCNPPANHRTSKIGTVTLSGSLNGGNASYNFVSIPVAGNDEASQFTVQLPNGKVVPLNELDEGEVLAASHDMTDYDKLGYSTNQPPGTKLVHVGGYSFWTRDGKILSVDASTVALNSAIKILHMKGGWKTNVPRIGRVGKQGNYEMPFSDEVVVELFGKPNEVYDEWHH